MDPTSVWSAASLCNIILTDGQMVLQLTKRSEEHRRGNRLERLSVVNDPPPSSPEITTARGVALIKLGPINHFIS